MHSSVISNLLGQDPNRLLITLSVPSQILQLAVATAVLSYMRPSYIARQESGCVDAGGGGGRGSHWLMIYGDAQRLEGAFSSYLVYQWMGFCPRPDASNLLKWVYFGKFGKKSTQFVSKSGVFVANWYSDGSQNHTY